MRPISSKFCVHSFTHTTGQTYPGGHSVPSGGTPTLVQGTWVMLANSQVIERYGLQSTDKAIVFVDAINSKPQGHVFKKGDLMEYVSGGLEDYITETLSVREANPQFTDLNGGLHHIELILK